MDIMRLILRSLEMLVDMDEQTRHQAYRKISESVQSEAAKQYVDLLFEAANKARGKAAT